MSISSRAFLAFLTLTLPLAAAAQGPAKPAKHQNRLALETSLYLRMHAHNPTNWYPWGPEAFAKAKKENKLVFLSIGYSSCYWCHVMERESFNHDEVAKVLNDDYVCIKVDREERPDIDHIYMTALQSFRSGGGWPLSMFLLPDGRPIVGGTYWPREDRKIEGELSPGFLTVLKNVTRIHRDNPKELEKAAEQVSASTLRALDGAGAFGLAIVSLDRKLLEEIVGTLKDEFDSEYGGFGSPQRNFRGPKFPMPSRLEFVLNQANRTKSDELLKMVTHTLDRMAHGGIYDHVGGGFHRYSTERTWLVPHFEKMLYDNAQLAELYARAFQETKKPLYRRIVEETLAYLEREMMSPEGAFYSSQDAETHHEEGRFYVWTPRELEEALPNADDLALVRKVYGADGEPNFEKTYHILHLPKPIADVAKTMNLTEADLLAKLAPVRKRLYDKRATRDRPLRNESALTSWSGLAIGGFAVAGSTLGEKRYVDVARKAAEFVLKHQKTADGRLLHTYGAIPGQPAKAAVPGYLEDYAYLVHGLLNLHEATQEPRWLDEAASLTDVMIRFYGEQKQGGYYMTANDQEKLFARAKDQYDGAVPSGNSVAVRNLVRLAAATGSVRYRGEAERNFRYFAGSLKSYGPSLVTMAVGLDQFLQSK